MNRESDELYGRILDVPANHTKPSFSNTFNAALEEAKQAIRKNTQGSTQQQRIEKLTERWGTRSNIETNVDLSKTLPINSTVVTGIGDYNLANWQAMNPSCSTYIILGDYHSGKITGKGIYVCDIYDSKYVPDSARKSTHIYFGNLSNQYKKAQSMWQAGDIRSYKHMDFNLYKHIYNPAEGQIPSVVVATCLHARFHDPDTEIYVYKPDMKHITYYDQLTLNRMGVNII